MCMYIVQQTFCRKISCLKSLETRTDHFLGLMSISCMFIVGNLYELKKKEQIQSNILNISKQNLVLVLLSSNM